LSWREAYFERGYLLRWRLGSPSDAELDEGAALLALSGIRTPARALDLGCGHGRYSFGFARAGCHVVGLDASQALLARGRNQGKQLPYTVHWVRGDMRALPFPRRSFDLVVLLSAFGYFDVEGEDIAFLCGVRDVLVHQGRLLMRNPNATRIRTNFKTHAVEERGGRAIEIQRRIDSDGRWMDEHVVIRDNTLTDEYQRRQLIYSASELDLVLAASGFEAVSHFASPSGESFEDDSSPSIITVAHPPPTSRSSPRHR
jgi:SAM-dependent methyltransferase